MWIRKNAGRSILNRIGNLISTIAIIVGSVSSSIAADDLQGAIESLSKGQLKTASQFLSDAEKTYSIEQDLYIKNDIATESADTTKIGVVRALKLVINDCDTTKLNQYSCKEIGAALMLSQGDSPDSGLKKLINLSKQTSDNPAITFLSSHAQFQNGQGKTDTKIDIPDWKKYESMFVNDYSDQDSRTQIGHFLFELAAYKASIAPLLSKKGSKSKGIPRLKAYMDAYNDFMNASGYVNDRRVILVSWRNSVAVGREAMKLMYRDVSYLAESRLVDRSDFRDILDSKTKQLENLGVGDLPTESTAESAFYFLYEFLDWLKGIYH